MAVRLHGGGLVLEPICIGPGKTAYVRSADTRIAELTGRQLGTDYVNTLLGDPTTSYWSLPPIAAVLAAERIETEAGPSMLAAIQKAHYVDGKLVSEPESLVAIAATLGLDARAFTVSFSIQSASAHVAQTHALMHTTGLQGFPGFAIERNGRFTKLYNENFYGYPNKFVDALRRSVGSDA